MHKPNKITFWLLLIAFIFWITTQIGYAKNVTESMPYKHFLIYFSKKVKRGDLITFKAPTGSYYHGLNITKQIVGMPGDIIITKKHEVFINSKYIATAKKLSKFGKPLNLIKNGVIPEKHYFVWVKHPDSYDSRYQELGLIDEKNIIGISYPLW